MALKSVAQQIDDCLNDNIEDSDHYLFEIGEMVQTGIEEGMLPSSIGAQWLEIGKMKNPFKTKRGAKKKADRAEARAGRDAMKEDVDAKRKKAMVLIKKIITIYGELETDSKFKGRIRRRKAKAQKAYDALRTINPSVGKEKKADEE